MTKKYLVRNDGNELEIASKPLKTNKQIEAALLNALRKDNFNEENDTFSILFIGPKGKVSFGHFGGGYMFEMLEKADDHRNR